jgi:hypothetical protein
MAALGNTGAGVALNPAAGSGNVIGGSTAAARNVISGNSGEGVRVGNVSGTRIEYNVIGADRMVAGKLPNARAAVCLVGATGTVVRSNTIFYVGALAVQLVSATGNSIGSNHLQSVLL